MRALLQRLRPCQDASRHPLECIAGCGQWKPLAAFAAAQQRKTIHRVCIDCEDFGVCKECGLKKPASEFTLGELGKSRKACRRGRCRACTQRRQEKKACRQCGEERPREEYTSDYAWSHASRICTICKPTATRQPVEQKPRSVCNVEKSEEHFSSRDWKRSNRRCTACKLATRTET